MDIFVRKATDEEIVKMKSHPTWSCEVSEFDWHYDSEEHCLLLEGEVTVEHDGKTTSFGAGDYVVLPQGMDCVWKVSKAVKKHYFFV